jgi:uncharacterized protein YdcH (DUF465 family)
MTIEHHSFAEEFPEFKDLIHELKLNDNHFKRLFDEYDSVDKEVVRFEQEVEVACDEHLEDVKKKRLKLKDELYAILTKAKETA